VLNTRRCFLPALQGEFQQRQYSRRGSHVAVARRQWGFYQRRPTIGSRPDVSAFGGAAPLTWALGLIKACRRAVAYGIVI